MKIYIAGPMSGYEDCNYPAFAQVAAILRNAGYEVVSPAELNDQNTGYAAAMMEGWPKSKGANVEFQIAVILGLEIKGNL